VTACAARDPARPTYDSFALTNFSKVSDEVYRSAQPSEAQLAQLVDRYGIKSVIKLNAGDAPQSCALADSPRISGWSVISRRSAPTAEQIKQILDAIDCAPKPVLIHCTHGEDRTGLIVALWRIRHGASVSDAYTDMIGRGFHSSFGGVWTAWKRETGWNDPDAEAIALAALAGKPQCGQAPALRPPQ
jgi:protein tyrosine phosphatase (PTP) superfamily phosphohydrolase (DUF442 family)